MAAPSSSRRRRRATTAMLDDGWSSLPEGIVILVAGRVLADDDLDYYMNLRAVCRRWRESTVDPKAHAGGAPDPRFQPKAWAVLKNYGYLSGSCAVSMVNLRTCRVLEKKLPAFRDCYFFNATDGGLLVIGEPPSFPDYRVWVLNPFTGSRVCFTVPMLSKTVRAVAVTHTSPMRLFVSDLWRFLGWAHPSARDFQVPNNRSSYAVASMTMMQAGGNDVLYVADRHGSIVSVVTAAHDDDEVDGSIVSVTIHQADDETVAWARGEDDDAPYPSYYLVQSAGELLLVVTTTTSSRQSGEEGRRLSSVQVHKVDTEKKVLEPVTDIGRRAIFISQVRSFVVDAFPTVEPGCIYFVDPTMDSLFKDGVVATSFRLADQRQEDVMDHGGLRICRGPPGPPTLVEVLADYCRFVPRSEYDFLNSSEEQEDDR